MNKISRKTAVLFVCIGIFFLHIMYHAVGHAAPEKNDSSQQSFPVPSTFGRTHFIVGMSADETNQVKQDAGEQPSSDLDVPINNGLVRRAYFSPDDGIEKKLIDLIDHEQISLKIAVFQFTNGEIARAVKRAQTRGVAIDIITDPLCLQDKFNKIAWLAQEGVKIYVYNADANKSTLSNKMHHKFVVFGKNVDDKKLVMMGSFNFTKSADIANQESVVVLDDNQIIGQFNNQYARLKERSVEFKEFARHNFVAQALPPSIPMDAKNKSTKKASVAFAKKIHRHKKDQLTISVVA